MMKCSTSISRNGTRMTNERTDLALNLLGELLNPDEFTAGTWRITLMQFAYLVRTRAVRREDVECGDEKYLIPAGLSALEAFNYDFQAKTLGDYIRLMSGLCDTWDGFGEMCDCNEKGSGKIRTLELAELREIARASRIVTAVEIWKKIIHYGWHDPDLPHPSIAILKASAAAGMAEKIVNLGSPYFHENARRELGEYVERTGKTIDDIWRDIGAAYDLLDEVMSLKNRPAPRVEDVIELVVLMREYRLSYDDLGRKIKKELNENVSADAILRKLDNCGRHIPEDIVIAKEEKPAETG